MSKRIEDSELQTLTLSPTNTNDDDSSPFVNPASDETSFPISRPPSYSTVTTTSSLATGEKRKLERIVSAPLNNNKPVPALRVSTPPGGSTRITYTNERSASDRKIDLSKISRDRPTPGNAMSQKKEAPHRQMDQPPRPSSGHVLSHSGGGVPRGPQVSRLDHNKSAEVEEGRKHSHSVKGGHAVSTHSQGKGSSVSPPPLARLGSGGKGAVSGVPAGRGGQSSRGDKGGISCPPAGRGGQNYRARLGSRVDHPKGFTVRGALEPRKMDRPTQHHTFLADVADVRQIEQGLLQLMEDFQAGNLRAFGKDSRLRQMETIREQQERLARLHFDVGAEQDLYPPLSEEGLRNSHDNMRTLMEKLAQLSESIERLQTNTTSSDRKCSTNERSKMSSHQMGSSSSGQGSTSSQHRMSSDHMNYPSGPHSSMFSQQLGDNVVGNRASDSAVMNNASPYSNLNNQVFSSSSHQSIPPISWRYNQGHHHTNSSANRPPRNAVDFQIGGMVMKGGKAAES